MHLEITLSSCNDRRRICNELQYVQVHTLALRNLFRLKNSCLERQRNLFVAITLFSNHDLQSLFQCQYYIRPSSLHSMEKNRSLQIHPINILQRQLLCANVKYPPLTLDGLINGYSTCQAVKTVIDQDMPEWIHLKYTPYCDLYGSWKIVELTLWKNSNTEFEFTHIFKNSI